MVPGKRDPGLVQGVLVGPSPAQPHGAPRSPICSGCSVVVSVKDKGWRCKESLSSEELSSCQASLGEAGGLFSIL